MGSIRYSLAPSFDCPFGWPKQPNYPIDKHSQNSPTSQSPEQQPLPDSEQDSEQLISLYLKALYAPIPYHSLIQSFSITLRSYHATNQYSLEELIETYESLLIPEHLLVKKWGEEVKKIAQLFSTSDPKLQLDFDQIDVQDQQDMFHLEEPSHIKGALQESYSNVSPLEPASNISTTKGSFIKPDSLSQQLEIWSVRETQLQIIILLELIILTNLTLDSGSQLLFHHKQLSSSPRKSRGDDYDRGGGRRKKEDDLANDTVFADLESALEGLIDRLAMWQIISGLENNLSSNKTSNTTASLVANPSTSGSLLDLDLVQRFWTDVIEENYVEHLPLLNRSFRPKLFPTSIYDPSASSSLVPTKFEATRRNHADAESRILSSVTRTPNLKRLERRQAAKTRGNSRESKEININLMSPTMIELNGLRKPKTITRNLSKTRSTSTCSNNQRVNTSHSHTQSSTNINSRSLFNRRQVKMSQVPCTKSKVLPIQQRPSNQSSVCFKSTTSIISNNTRPQINKNFKRKQSSPKRNQEPCRTELITTTPRKLIKFNDISNNNNNGNNNKTQILVPDTPQTSKKN